MEPLREQWIDPAATIEICQDIYEATTGRLQQLVDKAFASTRRLMIIGHNPGLEHLARLILGEVTAGDPRRMSMGALLVIEFPNGWGEGEGDARLQHWLERYHFE
jgi:phosphohistidine phosphatase SixA